MIDLSDLYQQVLIATIGAIAAGIIVYLVNAKIQRDFVMAERLWSEKYNGFKLY